MTGATFKFSLLLRLRKYCPVFIEISASLLLCVFVNRATLQFTCNAQFSVVLSIALSPACTQRGSGLTQWRLPLHVMRRTAFSSLQCRCCGLPPPLRQTACCVSGINHSLKTLTLIPIRKLALFDCREVV